MSDQTRQFGWKEIRTMTSSDTDISVTPLNQHGNRKWANFTNQETLQIINNHFSAISFRFRSTASNDTDVDYHIYFLTEFDDLIHAATGTITNGQQTATLGGTYIDSITCTQHWINQFSIVNPASDYIASLSVDTAGVSRTLVHLIDSSWPAGTWSVDMRGWT